MPMATRAGLLEIYEYDPSNKRVYQQKLHYDGNNWVADAMEFYFYGLSGKKIGTYYATVSGTGAGASLAWSAGATQVFFKGRLISRSGGTVQEDIRGSVGGYFPYGEDRTTTANDVIKFASYVRDSLSGLDYAHHRYHIPGTGRFTTPDPSGESGRRGNPLSWNRYPYVQGDPINATDRHGLNVDACDEEGEEECCDDYGENCRSGEPGNSGGGDNGTVCDANGDNCYDSIGVRALLSKTF